MKRKNLEIDHNKVWEEFIVEEIIDKRFKHNNIEYLVKWKDYDHDTNTWEPIKNL